MSLRDAIKRGLRSGLQFTEVEPPPEDRRRFHLGHSEDQEGEIILVQFQPAWGDSFVVYLVRDDKWFVAEVPVNG